ncbi:unnamed protein product [Pichia kudriavzevii]
MYSAKLNMGTYLDIVKKVDSVPYLHEKDHDHFTKNIYTLYSHDGSFQLGYILPIICKELSEFPEYFHIDDCDKSLKFSSSLKSIETRCQALEEIGKIWRSSNKFETLKGWRNEKYTIYDNDGEPYFYLERSMCPLFGVVMYGVHINGYVKDSRGNYRVWVPRRAADKATFPGMLDNTVAGGLGYPYGPEETVFKECYEEAGLEESYLVDRIKSCGSVSYLYQLNKNVFNSELGLIQPEVEYIYDLQMDSETIPHPVDHEAEDFRLMDLEEIKERLLDGEFKDNCGAVMIDFMIRHSLLKPEDEANFVEINSRLHRFLPFPVKSN